MNEQRFFIQGLDITKKNFIFPNDISHQVLHVLRLQKGDRVTVLDGEGRACQVEINEIKGSQVTASLIEISEIKSPVPAYITLFFPLSRREKVEWILQKGTEVGVSTFQPFTSDRSLVQKLSIDQKKITRWEAIIREAAEQSGRVFLPELLQPKKLGAIFQEDLSNQFDHLFVASLTEKENRIASEMSKIPIENKQCRFALFIGAEGGFSDSELACFLEKGIQAVSIGKTVLRMETAAIVFPALVISNIQNQPASE